MGVLKYPGYSEIGMGMNIYGTSDVRKVANWVRYLREVSQLENLKILLFVCLFNACASVARMKN